MAGIGLFALASALAACEGPPWEKMGGLTVQIDVHRGGTRVPASELQEGPDRLMLIHRADIFRPRNLSPRGHDIHFDCVGRDRDGTPEEPARCRDLFVQADGSRPVAVDLVQGVAPLLALNQAVLYRIHASLPTVPQLHDLAPGGSAPLRGQVSFDGRDLYWVHFWSSCRGCVGLVSLQATWRGHSYCVQPRAIEGGSLRFDVDLAPAGQPGPRDGAAVDGDQPLCGDPFWFDLYSAHGVIRFRPPAP